MESVNSMHELVAQLINRKISFENHEYVEEFMNHLHFLLNIATNVEQTLAHPLRMFPVGALMEMPSNSFGNYILHSLEFVCIEVQYSRS